MHRTRNAAYGQPYRGFESPPLRQLTRLIACVKTTLRASRHYHPTITPTYDAARGASLRTCLPLSDVGLCAAACCLFEDQNESSRTPRRGSSHHPDRT